jgi:hypothetical protein
VNAGPAQGSVQIDVIQPYLRIQVSQALIDLSGANEDQLLEELSNPIGALRMALAETRTVSNHTIKLVVLRATAECQAGHR